MCYSAMVEQDAKKLARQFDAEVQIKMYAELFQRRLDGEKLYINKAMEIPFLTNAKTMDERSVGVAIRKWHENEINRLTRELEKQEMRLVNALQELEKKETKKAQEDKRISTSKISKCKLDLERHESEKLESESESRIYPLHYASLLCLNEKNERVIMPMRYLMRPHNETEDFDRTHNGCYNARFDSLTKVAFWRDSLEKRRGIMVVRKFYENVPLEKYPNKKTLSTELKEKDNIVVCFEPQGVEEMYIPVIWDCWRRKGESALYTAALITDDPAPEVKATGHDRTPIFLKASAIDSWLYATGTGKEIKEGALLDREKPYYGHKVLGVAS